MNTKPKYVHAMILGRMMLCEVIQKPMTKIFIIINAGSVSAVYADSNAVEVEIVDQDSQEEGERDKALTREDEIAAEYVKVG
jgi:hypothetical protein